MTRDGSTNTLSAGGKAWLKCVGPFINDRLLNGITASDRRPADYCSAVEACTDYPDIAGCPEFNADKREIRAKIDRLVREIHENEDRKAEAAHRDILARFVNDTLKAARDLPR